MATWTVIDHTYVSTSGGVSAWEVTDIPETYGALWCEVTGRNTYATTYVNFWVRFTQGSGSSPTWDTSGGQYINAVMSTPGNGGNPVVYVHQDSKFYHLMYMPGTSTANTNHNGTAFFVIPGYSDATTYTSVLGQCHPEDAGGMPMFNVIGTWRETSPVR